MGFIYMSKSCDILSTLGTPKKFFPVLLLATMMRSLSGGNGICCTRYLCGLVVMRNTTQQLHNTKHCTLKRSVGSNIL